MMLPRRRKASVRWPFIAASALAAAAAFLAWTLLREKDSHLTDEELREVEAFDEYERIKRAGAN